MHFRKGNLSLTLILSLVLSYIVLSPMAQAEYASPKTSDVTVGVDGNVVGLSPSATNQAGDNLGGAFGGGNYSNDSSASELTAMYTAKSGGLFYFQAQGGVEKITCAGGGSSEYYQRATVTLNNLPSGTKDVWAFYDPAVGSGDVVKSFPHFKDQGIVDGGSPIANTRVSNSANIAKLCDGSTQYVAGTPGTLVLGAGSDVRTTSGVVQDDITSTTVNFDVYVPMDGSSNGSTSIFLALGLLVDMGGDGTLDDTTDDVGIETWVSSRPWWGPGERDETHVLLEACSGPTASDSPCVEATSGVFAANGTTRLDSGYSVVLEMVGDADSFEANLELAATSTFSSGVFGIPSGSVTKIAVSWPTTGNLYGALPVGTGDSQLNFAIASGDSPILVNPATTNVSSNTNRWDIDSSGDRVVTTIVGTARAMSSAISRATWWPQCSVSITGSTVTSDKCGEGMDSSVTDDYMVFSSVPAKLNLMVSADAAALAGGLVSTNGQGFAFGPRTFAGTAFEFAVSGPSYDFNNAARSTDGFYYVCVPSNYLSGSFDTTPAEAASAWQGTRDGSVVADTSFQTGTCGDGNSGLVASLNPFGYSSPLFAIQPTPPAAAPAPAPAAPQAYRGPAPSGISTKIAFEGDSITVIGRRLDLVGSLEIDGVAASITSKASKALVFTMPSSLSPGIKQLVMKSSHGILTYYPGLQLVEKAPAPVTDASASEVVEVVEQLGKVNAGSFNGYIAVYAKGHKGKTLSWKIAGKWFKTTVTSDYQVFQRKTAAIGLNVKVDLYVGGKRELSKTVLTR